MKLPSSAEQSNAQGACAAEKNNLQSFFIGSSTKAANSFLILLFTVTFSFQSDVSAFNKTSAFEMEMVNDIITMEGDILLTGTGDDEDEITFVEVFNSSLELMFSVAGCNSESCQNDVSELENGTYFVVVTSTNGHTSKWVTKS